MARWFRSDNAQSGSSLYNNVIDSNQYGLYFGGTTGYTFKNNRLNRNATLNLYAPAEASLTHTNNSYWRASASENTATYGGSSYTTANVTDLEATAVASNPATNLEVVTSRNISHSYYTGSVLWAGDYSGKIAHSEDRGQSWTDSKTFNGGLRVGAVFVSSLGYVFANAQGGTDQGIWRSTDGSTFTQVLDLTGMAAETNVRSIVEDSNGKLFAGLADTSGSGYACQIYRSTDNGATWSKVYDNVSGRYIADLSVDLSTNNIYAATGDFTSPWLNRDVVKSVDGGDNWSQIMPTIPQVGAILAQPTFRLFASDSYGIFPSNNGRIWRSTDDVTWTEVLIDSGPSYAYWFRRDTVSGLIYVSFVANEDAKTTARIYVSADDGNTWTIARILPAVSSFDGYQYASNIVNGLFFLNAISTGSPRNAIGYFIGREASYALPEDSLCIDAGTPIQGLHDSAWEDYSGHQFEAYKWYGKGVDIGAYEMEQGDKVTMPARPGNLHLVNLPILF